MKVSDYFFSLIHRIKKLQFFILFFFNLIVVCSVVKFLPVRYEENDDIMMLLISAGDYSGSPDAHLVFINYIYGFLIKLLYAAVPSIEWYTISFLVLHILALSIILSSVVNKQIDIVFKILIFFVFYALALRLVLCLQFTTVAAIVTFSGIVLNKEEGGLKPLLGFCLIVIGSLIRFEASILVMLISSPLFFRSLIEGNRFVIAKQGVFFILILFSVGILKYSSNLIYSGVPEWKDYLEYNYLRGKVNDNPNAFRLTNNLPVDINNNDYDLLLNFIPDKEVINTDKLKEVDGNIKSLSFSEKIKNILPGLSDYKIYIALVLLMAIVMFFYSKKTSRSVYILLYYGLFLSAICVISLDGTLKYRVFVSALLPLIYLPVEFLGFCVDEKMLINSRAYIYICMLLLSAVFLFSAGNITAETMNKKVLFNEQQNLIARYLADSEKTIVPFKSDYYIELHNPLSVSKSYFAGRIFFGGWLTNIPFNVNHFDSYKDFINGHGLFMKKSSQWVVSKIIQSIAENYGIQVESRVAAQSDSCLIVELVNSAG